MNWEFIWKYLPMYERAAWLTVRIGFAGVACAIILGLICAVVQYEKIPLLKQIQLFTFCCLISRTNINAAKIRSSTEFTATATLLVTKTNDLTSLSMNAWWIRIS